jgi:multidrug transporter EmrE-like cation transporter
MAWTVLVIVGLFEIGWAVGTAVFGILLFAEPANALRLASIALIVAGIAGLKLTA